MTDDPLFKNPQRIFSWKQLVAVLAACGFTLYLLLPDNPTLLENLVEDGKVEEARALLGKVGAAERATDPLRYALAEQRLAQMELGNDAETHRFDSYIVAAIHRWADLGYAEPLLDIWIQTLPRLSALDEVWSVLKSYGPAIPQAAKERLVPPLVAVALGLEQPLLAATIYAETYGDSPGTPAPARELARLFRLAGNAEAALRALANTDAPELGRLRVALLRELNRNHQALDLLLVELAGAEEVTSEQVSMVVQTARGAGRPLDAIPVVQTYLSQHPDSLEGWRALVMLQRESGLASAAAESQARVVALANRAKAELREWARLLEGTGRAHEAFTVWRELSEQGDVKALDRMVALNPGLFRDRELIPVLESLVPVAGHADYTLLLARLLVNTGRYDAAMKVYQDYLAGSPDDFEAMLEIAILAEEVLEYEESARWLTRLEKIEGENETVMRKLGDVWSSLGEYEKSLAAYRKVAELSQNEEDFGNYLRLARSLGAHDDFVAGLEGVVRSDEATPSDYLSLAYGHELMGQKEQAKKTLHAGLDRFPRHAQMTIQLAYAYSDAKRYREAQEVVRQHPELGNQIEPTRLYLIVMRMNHDDAAEQAFLQRPLSDAIWSDAGTKQILARTYLAQEELSTAERLLVELHESQPHDWNVTADLIFVLQRQGRSGEAKALLKPLLSNDDDLGWRLSAEVSSALGEYGEAERYQLKYLALTEQPQATDWGALGDIRLSRGDPEGAKRAYLRALQIFQTNMKSAEGGQS